MKRSVGAIVVKQFRLVSSGYNGTPGGFPNCYENGCERCNSNAVINNEIIINYFKYNLNKFIIFKEIRN